MYTYPKKIAIIMDGNRRWAQERKLPIFSGHTKGASTLKRIIKDCVDLNIYELTVFAFSTENWSRDKKEINSLIKLIEIYLKAEIADINYNNVKFRVIGDTTCFSKIIQDLLLSSEDCTKNNTGMKLNICLNYGGMLDIINAAKEISKKILLNQISIDNIDEQCIKENLLSSPISDIDLLIRTSGESRISNFLPIQLSYAELFFTETLWPDFKKKDLLIAFDYYSKRERRFGATQSVQK